jgi:hypothetical protein
MRYGYDGVYERQGLGVKRAFAVAIFYTGTMAGCALAIMLCADHVAREAAAMLMPPASSPALQQHAAAAVVHKPGASNAAIIASIEARQASVKTSAAKAAVIRPAKAQTAANTAGRKL